MQKGVFYIFSGLRGIFPAGIAVLLSVMLAAAQKPVQHIVMDQCESYIFGAVEMPGDRYTWHLYHELDWDEVNFAQDAPNVDPTPYFDDGNYQTDANHPSVKVSGLEPGDYFLKLVVWDEVECTNNLVVFRITVEEKLPTVVLEEQEGCYGDVVEMKFILTGTGPWKLFYSYSDGVASVNLNGTTEDPEFFWTIPPTDPGEIEVWVTAIIDQCTSNFFGAGEEPRGRVIINPLPKSSDIYVKPEP